MSCWQLATVAGSRVPAGQGAARFRPGHPGRWLALAAVLAMLGVGCAHPPAPPVQPWQREHLAKRAMRFDADPLEAHFKQHWYGSREGSDLGFGTPGGGCGCN